MAKIDDMIFNGIKVILSGTPATITKSGPKLKNLIKKTMKEKKITGKPKGKSPSMVLGSASKAGMQSKQGKRPRRPNPMSPRPTGRPPKSAFNRKKLT
tara:strand:+ start:205 stop:498 length:294 start_codon:yes stop_codon:yes gene_type:complete